MEKLLITGVPGWLSHAFIESLSQQNFHKISSIRCLIAPGVSVDRTAVEGLAKTALEFVEGDLRNKNMMLKAVEGVSHVLHTAGLIHVRKTQDWYDVNTAGTSNLFDAAAEAGAKRFVFVSSNAASGRSSSKDRLLTESETPKPLHHYGRSKLLAEQYMLNKKSKTEPVILRPCMFYGPPVPSRHVEIYRRIVNGRMPLIGTGEYARSVTHISTLVDACHLALTHENAPGQTYFVADKQVYTTGLIIDAMAQALGAKVKYLRLPRIVAPVAFSVDKLLASLGIYWQEMHLVGEADWHVGVSTSKIENELGLKSKVDLFEGMRDAVEWCRTRGLL